MSPKSQKIPVHLFVSSVFPKWLKTVSSLLSLTVVLFDWAPLGSSSVVLGISHVAVVTWQLRLAPSGRLTQMLG